MQINLFTWDFNSTNFCNVMPNFSLVISSKVTSNFRYSITNLKPKCQWSIQDLATSEMENFAKNS